MSHRFSIFWTYTHVLTKLIKVEQGKILCERNTFNLLFIFQSSVFNLICFGHVVEKVKIGIVKHYDDAKYLCLGFILANS